MGADDKHYVTLDVMPLTRGFLPLPVVRLSKYISGDGKVNSKGEFFFFHFRMFKHDCNRD